MALDRWLDLKLPPDLDIRMGRAHRRKADLSYDLIDDE